MLLRNILFCLMIIGCASSKDQSEENQIPPPKVNCPEGGDCSFEVLQNSELSVKTDGTGASYVEIVEGDKVVIRYQYKKDPQPDVVDAGYSEYLFFEIDAGRVEMSLKDSELKRAKMVYGRLCYCKGESGYFPVRKGSLFVYQNKGDLLVRASFSIPKIPQIIEEIDERLTYYPVK